MSCFSYSFVSLLNKGNTAQFGKKPQPGFLAQFQVWKTKEYCMYFSFFKLKKWGKKTAAARRHNCAVWPKNRPRLKFLETGPVRIQSLAVPLKLRTKMRPFRLQQALGTDVACTESPTDGSRVWAFSSEGIRSSPSPARLPPSPALCKVDHADPSSSSLFYSVIGAIISLIFQIVNGNFRLPSGPPRRARSCGI